MVKKAADGPPVNKMVDGAGGEKKEAEDRVLGDEIIQPVSDDSPVDLEAKVVELEEELGALGNDLQELDSISEIHAREIRDLQKAKGKAQPTKVECQDCEAWDGVNSKCCLGPVAQAKTFNDWCLAGILSERRRAERLVREGKKG